MTAPPSVQRPAKTPRQRLSSGVKALEGDRIMAILGGLLVIVATALPWYSRHSVDVSLWDVRDLAAWLITGAAVFGALMPVVLTVDERSAGSLAAFAGTAIVVYSVIALFVVPDLGSGARISVGPFLAIAGGILLALGGIATTGDTAIEEAVD